VYSFISQIAIPRGRIIRAKKPNKTNTQIGSGHFLCLSVYLFKKNTLSGLPDKTDTQKNSQEQKNLRTSDLCIRVSVYRVKKGCDFFERRGEKRIDRRWFFGYVCHVAKACDSDGSLFLSKSALFLISLCVCAYKHKK